MQVVGRTHVETPLDDEKPIKPAEARDSARHRAGRASFGHELPHTLFELLACETLDRDAATGGELLQQNEVACVARD